VLVLVLVHVLAHGRTQIASTDRVDPLAFVVVLTPGSRLCQQDEIVPSDTAALRMTIGTYGDPGPRLAFAVTVPDPAGPTATRLLASGVLAHGWQQGKVRIPIAPRVRGNHTGATVCISNLGATQVAIAGSTVLGDYGFNDYLNGRYYAAEVRVDYMLPGRPSWLEMVPRLAYRMTLGKGGVGAIGWIAPLLAMLALAAIVVRVLLAAERES